MRRRHHNWRSRFNVLVTDAGTLAGIGVIRSLGRAGYRVVAAADCADALGLRSRYVDVAAVRPACTDADFVPWMRRTIAGHAVQAVIASHAVMIALRPAWAEFAPLLTVAQERDIADCGLSKYALFEALRRAGSAAQAHLPRLRLIGPDDPAPSAEDLQDLGFPLFAKADAIHGLADSPDRTLRLESADEALRELGVLRKRYGRITLQGFAPGCGVGAFFLIHNGCVLAEFMHRRVHEVPHTGGVSALRESWRHEAIRADALSKLRALKWQGVAMMEYRWDARTDAFALMEMNGRFWGSLHLALHAGVDFPTALVDAHLGRPAAATATWPMGIRCRHTFPRELQYVWSLWKDRDIPVWIKAARALECAALCLDPRMHADLSFPGDRRLCWINLARQARGAVRRMLAYTRGAPSTTLPLNPRKAF